MFFKYNFQFKNNYINYLGMNLSIYVNRLKIYIFTLHYFEFHI